MAFDSPLLLVMQLLFLPIVAMLAYVLLGEIAQGDAAGIAVGGILTTLAVSFPVLGMIRFPTRHLRTILPLMVLGAGQLIAALWFMMSSPVVLLMPFVSLLFVVLALTGCIKAKWVLILIESLCFGASLLLAFIAGTTLYAYIVLISVFTLNILLICSLTDHLREEPAGKKARTVAVTVGLVAFLLIGAANGFYTHYTFVPTLVGAAETDIADMARSYRIRVKKEYVYDDTVKKGNVVEQDVKAHSLVEPNALVTIAVSKGPGVVLPDLRGQSEKDAKAAATKLGLTPECTYEYHTSVKKGTVIEHDAHVDEGAVVHITISKGPDLRVEIPSVVDLDESKAVSKLKGLGFTVKTVYSNDACDAYSGKAVVKEQDKIGKYDKGTIITLTVLKPSIKVIRAQTYDKGLISSIYLELRFQNTSKKTIKDIVFTTYFVDESGKMVSSGLPGSMNRLQYKDERLAAGETQTAYWDWGLIYGSHSRVTFRSIDVTFEDGSSQSMTFDGILETD